MPPNLKPHPYTIKGTHTAQPVSSSVVTLTQPANAELVMLQAVEANIRFTLDGTDPVGEATGFLLYDGHAPSYIDLPTSGLTLKFIRDGSTDAELQYQFMG
jgi:hypothetical protein